MGPIAVLFDAGDVLIREATIVRGPDGVTADLMPGIANVLARLYARGVKLGLVSNSARDFTPAVFGAHCLYHLFEGFAISGVVGYQKPDPRLFRVALDQMGILPQDYARVLMVGDILEKDVLGANSLGLVSVWFHWNDRYRSTVETESERPRHVVHSVGALDSLLAEWGEKGIEHGRKPSAAGGSRAGRS